MCLRASVGRPHGCGEVGLERDQTDRGGVAGDVCADETLIVRIGLVNGLPRAVVLPRFDAERLQHAFREAHARIIVVETAEERDRDIQKVGIALDVFAVEVAVDDETEGGDVRDLFDP